MTHDSQSDDGIDEEERFLPEDADDDNLSNEVKDLMRKLQNNNLKGKTAGEVEEPNCTKVMPL